MALPDGAIGWVEERCGGRVVDIEQQVRWRPHHFLTVDLPDGTMRVLVRSERQGMAGGSKFQQHFDLAHEARVLEALQGHGLKVPKFYGFNDEHRFILMERVDGTNELKDAPDDETRERVMAEYIEQLVSLHRTRCRVDGALGPQDPHDTGKRPLSAPSSVSSKRTGACGGNTCDPSRC